MDHDCRQRQNATAPCHQLPAAVLPDVQLLLKGDGLIDLVRGNLRPFVIVICIKATHSSTQYMSVTLAMSTMLLKKRLPDIVEC